MIGEWALFGEIPDLADPPSSRTIQALTRFAKLEVLAYRGIGLGDPVGDAVLRRDAVEAYNAYIQRRLVRAYERLGAYTLNTCVNYQIVSQARFGEHLAWGDTGTVIYANSVFGARSNFESGPAALAEPEPALPGAGEPRR